MCGIVGVVGTAHDAAHRRMVAESMARTVKHRGPDDAGIFSDESAALAHTRLAILDLSPAGHQPMASHDGRYWMVYNGELYNFAEIRDELAHQYGRTFRSQSDSEVVVEAFAVWGASAFMRFNGMFAVAIWDTVERALWLARDHIGIKPLYFRTEQPTAEPFPVPGTRFIPPRVVGGIAFASEIKAFWADPHFRAEIHPTGLCHYLAFGHSMGDETMLAGVRKLPPGWVLRWNDGEITRWRWHREAPTDVPATFSGACEWVRETLVAAVRRQLVADVPVGLFLSGGVDSSALALLAAKHLGATRTNTFCLGFRVPKQAASRTEFDETADAKLVAAHLGTHHRTLIADENDLIQTIDALAYHYDEPFGDEAALPVMLLSRLTREHVTVCLSGEGADELFGGYRRYVTEPFLSRHAWLRTLVARSPLRWAIDSLPRLRRLKTMAKVFAQSDPAARYAAYLTVLDAAQRHQLLRPEWQARGYDPIDLFRAHDPGEAAGHVGRLCLLDQRLWLVDAYLEKADKASMAASLEVRVPFLDREVMRVANALPDSFRIRRGQKKRVLREAFRGELPNQILDKPKHGFSVPIAVWFRGPLADYLRNNLLGPDARCAALFERPALTALVDSHTSGRSDCAFALWNLLVLERWLRRFDVPVGRLVAV